MNRYVKDFGLLTVTKIKGVIEFLFKHGSRKC